MKSFVKNVDLAQQVFCRTNFYTSVSTVFLVFDTASSKTCSRHIFAVVGPWSAFSSGKYCNCRPPSSTLPPRRPVPDNVSQSFVPPLVGEPSTRRPGLCCTQLQPSTSSSTLPPRRPVPDTVSLSFVPVLVGPWSAGGSGRCCSRSKSRKFADSTCADKFSTVSHHITLVPKSNQTSLEARKFINCSTF